MKETKEKGVTLIALVIVVIVLIIIITIGTNVGMSSIKIAKFNQFKNELKVIQVKVNELNFNNQTEIGEQLSESQKNILNNTTIINIIYNGKTEEEKTDIQNSFRYCSKDYMKNELGLESVERNYFINVKYRYVIFEDGFEYNGTTYYMSEQMNDGNYNVEYKNKNSESGSFELKSTKESDKWKIEVTNIQYTGYINNWDVKYRAENDTKWNTTNGLSFYVNTTGNYYVKVGHGDNISLGSKLITVSE